MHEDLSRFRARTRGFSSDSLPPPPAPLTTAPGLTAKVGPAGELLPFAGDTVVFPLPARAKAAAACLQDLLHHRCGGLLAQRLPPDSLHLTLHDLNSGPAGASLTARMDAARPQAEEILSKLREEPPIPMRSTWVFSMASTSVVLGLEPRDDAACLRLMDLYDRFQSVVPLGYPLTPHITLAYYRPGVYGQEELHPLRGALTTAAWGAVELELEPRLLRYHRFADMRDF